MFSYKYISLAAMYLLVDLKILWQANKQPFVQIMFLEVAKLIQDISILKLYFYFLFYLIALYNCGRNVRIFFLSVARYIYARNVLCPIILHYSFNWLNLLHFYHKRVLRCDGASHPPGSTSESCLFNDHGINPVRHLSISCHKYTYFSVSFPSHDMIITCPPSTN